MRLAPSGNPDIRYNEISAVNTNGTNSIDTIFTTAFGGTITEKMRITSTGNVGIGTTSPGQKLSVAGDILGNNVIGSYFTGTSTATSTLSGGLSTTRLNVTSGTSTFANGTNLTAGCYAIGGTCLSLSTISGTLGVANGGTGSTTLSGILVGNGTSAIQTLTVSSPLTFSGSTLAIQNAAADGTTKGAAAFTAADFDATSGLISIDYTNGQAASASNKGFLTSADWTVFNNKISSSSLAQIFPFTPVSYGNSTSTTIGFTNGLLSTASSTFTSNTYFPGSGIWNSSGNVGIGTTSPEVGLSINGADSYGLLHLTNTSSNGTASISFRSADDANGGAGQWLVGKNLGGLTGDQFSIWQGGSGNRLTINSSGFVGVGTSTPSAELNVFDSTNSGAVIQIDTPGTQASQQSALQLITKSDAANLGTASNLGWQITGRGNAYTTAAEQNDLKFYYWNGSTYNNAFTIDSLTGNTTLTYASTTQLSVSGNTYFPGSGIWNSSGNVGIGTTTPSVRLHLYGTSPVVHFTDSNASADEQTWSINGNAGSLAFQGINDAGSGGGDYVAFTRSGNAMLGLTFYDNAAAKNFISNAGDSYFTSGNVGIGTTTPNSLLTLQAVNGSAVLRVNATNASGDAKSVSMTRVEMNTLLAAIPRQASLIFQAHKQPLVDTNGG